MSHHLPEGAKYWNIMRFSHHAMRRVIIPPSVRQDPRQRTHTHRHLKFAPCGLPSDRKNHLINETHNKSSILVHDKPAAR